jgi:hypothetical protein
MSTDAAPAEKKTPWALIIFGGFLVLGVIAGYVFWKDRKFLSTPKVDATKPSGTATPRETPKAGHQATFN